MISGVDGRFACFCLEIIKMSATPELITMTALIRHDWQLAEIEALFALPFNDLLFKAQTVHRVYFDPNEIQVSSLLSIKTGSCSEDCGYCPQSARYDSDLNPEALMPVDAVLKAAQQAKDQGASRFCMGAAWRSPKDRDIERVVEMVQGVKALGMETCVTLGMLTDKQTQALKDPSRAPHTLPSTMSCRVAKTLRQSCVTR